MTKEEFLTRLDKLPDSQLITENHLSSWLQVSTSKIQKDRLKGNGIPYLKPGGAVRYRVGDVRQYLKSVSYKSTSGYTTNFETGEGVTEELYGPHLPFFRVNGELFNFFESLDKDVDEVIWLDQKQQREKEL